MKYLVSVRKHTSRYARVEEQLSTKIIFINYQCLGSGTVLIRENMRIGFKGQNIKNCKKNFLFLKLQSELLKTRDYLQVLAAKKSAKKEEN